MRNISINETNWIEVDGITFIEYVEDREVVMISSGSCNYNYLGFETVDDFGELSVSNCIAWIESNMSINLLSKC